MIPTVALAVLIGAIGLAGAGMTAGILLALVNGTLPEFLSQLVQGFLSPESYVDITNGAEQMLKDIMDIFLNGI